MKLAATWRRFLAPLALLILFGLAWGFGLHRSLSLDALAAHRANLGAEVAAHPITAALLYVLAYVVVVALSLPGGVVMTLAGGLLFGLVLGTILTVLGASLGALQRDRVGIVRIDHDLWRLPLDVAATRSRIRKRCRVEFA